MCLGREEVVLQEILQKAMGRYDRAMKKLVLDILNEKENPVDNLVQALEKVETPECSQRAAVAIEKGVLTFGTYYTPLLLSHNDVIH